MIEAIRGRERGQWWPRADGAATYYCADCGNPMGLENHAIQPDGTLNPSVVCPHVYPQHAAPTIDCKCGFHNYVQLIGWKKEVNVKICVMNCGIALGDTRTEEEINE